MFEHVDAQRIVRVCEEAWLAEQRRESRRDGGTGVAFFLVTFFGEAKKVTSCRATPDGFDSDFNLFG